MDTMLDTFSEMRKRKFVKCTLRPKMAAKLNGVLSPVHSNPNSSGSHLPNSLSFLPLPPYLLNHEH